MLYSKWDELLWDGVRASNDDSCKTFLIPLDEHKPLKLWMENNDSFMIKNFNMPFKFKNEGVITMGKRPQNKLMNKYGSLCIVDGNNDNRTMRRFAVPLSYKVCDNGRVVIVEFSDRTTEKAVLSKDDAIMYGNKNKNELIKTGFEICVMKKILSVMFDGYNMTGTKIFNSIIRFADKAVDRIDKEEAEKKNHEQAIKNKKRKEQERKKRRAERRRKEEFNRQVEIQKEAIIRANAEMNNK